MKLHLMRAFLFPALVLLLLEGCAQGSGVPAVKPWPTHEPGATPYVRSMKETAPAAEEGTTETFSWDSIYERFGSFYAKKDELATFRELPQDKVFSFVPHSARFVLNEGEALRIAKLFDAQENCEARVIAMHQITDGVDDWSFLTVVSCTPARLFEMGGEIPEEFMIEQFYPSVQERFDIAYWPEGLWKESDEILQDLEVRGCFYFEPDTLERFEGLARDEVCDFALQAYTPSGWSRDANGMIWMLQRQEGVELSILFKENAVPSESLCLASMTLSRLSVLSEELPGRYLVRIADETLRSDYDGVVRLQLGPDGEAAEVREP